MNQKSKEEFYSVNPIYIETLYAIQVELLKLQKHISDNKLRLAIFFEGRDTAGKGSAIARFTQFLNPQLYKVVALGKPSKIERGQWYFQRHFKNLPNAGRITFFDRSWYNRAVVEPAMGFCTDEQYEQFMQQVVMLEKMLIEDGLKLVKFWFSIKMAEQAQRISERVNTPLIQWKVSPVDLAAQEKWEDFSRYKQLMFERTSTDYAPWISVRGERKEDTRIQAMKYILSLFEYPNKDVELCTPDPSKVDLWDKVQYLT